MNELCKKSSRALYPLLGNVSKFYAGSIKILIELFDQNASIITIPSGNINKARNILKSHDISNPSKILLYVGINDIDNKHPEDIAYKLKLLAEEYKEKLKCEVFLSAITPRKDQYHQGVEMVNDNLNRRLRNSNTKRVKHSNIKSQHLHDDRHLKRNRTAGEVMSGVQLCCKNIYDTMTQRTVETELSKKSQWYPSKNLYNRGIKNSRYQNKTLNSYLQHQSKQQNH